MGIASRELIGQTPVKSLHPASTWLYRGPGESHAEEMEARGSFSYKSVFRHEEVDRLVVIELLELQVNSLEETSY